MKPRRLGFGHARRSLTPFVGPRYRWLLGTMAVLGLALGAVEAFVLAVIGELVGSIELGESVRSLGPFDDLTIARLATFGGLAIVVLVLLRFAETALIARIGVHPLTNARSKLTSTFLSAEHRAQQELTSGTYHELVIAHAVRVGSISMATATMVSSIVVALALSVAAVLISPAAFVVLAAVMFVVVMATSPLNSLAQRLGRGLAVAHTDLANASVEAVEAATDARLYGVEPQMVQSMNSRVDDVSKIAFRNHAVGFFGASLFQALMLGVLVGLTAIVASAGGEGFAAAGTVALLALRAQMAARKAITSNLAIATSAPFAAGLEAQIERLPRRHSTGEVPVESIVRFEARDISFGFESSDRQSGKAPDLLAGVDLVVSQGEHVGIIGPSGSGKSTLLSILLGLTEPLSGSVLINGHERSYYDDASVRQQIAAVQQKPNLMTATVAENIRFYRTGISDEQVARAAERAGVLDEITSWSSGFDTIIGDRGTRQVSGGQAQRICIARALAGDPSLIIMDEPTSSVDESSEQLILDTLTALSSNCAAIIVSHRPTSLGSCDRILKLSRHTLSSLGAAAHETINQSPSAPAEPHSNDHV